MKRGLPVIVRMARVTTDDLLWAALALSAASGILLASHYDPNSGQSSVATWLLGSPLLTWIRAVHFWSAALVVGTLLWQVASRLWRPARAGRAVWLLTALLVATYAFVSGILLRGDPGTEHWRVTLAAWFGRITPGTALAVLLWGRSASANVMYMVHAAALIALVFLAWRAGRRQRTFSLARAGAVAAGVGVLGLVTVPGLDDHGSGGVSWRYAATQLRLGPLLASRPPDGFVVSSSVRGRPEGCLSCHPNVRGLGDAHDAAKVGCVACHRGDAFARSAEAAHRGLVRIPGNLADASRTCGQSGCHDSIPPRVERSIMTTMAGVVAVDRAVFGESDLPTAPPDVRALGHSTADAHLRQLCASCHLGQTKSVWGANTEASRGGGCNACHLTYSPTASIQLTAYESAPQGSVRRLPTEHPALSANPPTANCFGCHSRSSRISLNYAGWREADVPEGGKEERTAPTSATATRQLADGRVLVPETADVHAERGLECIDCHSSAEVMGKDVVVRRKGEQARLRCEDCHANRLPTLDPTFADAETTTLLQLRHVALPAGERLAVSAAGDPLVNVLVATDGRASLMGKETGRRYALRPPTAACGREAAHARLTCETCHSAWAPRCVSCHTAFDAKSEAFDHVAQTWVTGAWVEKGAAEKAVPPTLGVRVVTGDPEHPNGVIDPFVPGMILQLDRPPAPALRSGPVFLRLYARIAPHTTRREARSCVSCHSDPVAIGFGEGSLTYVVVGSVGRWEFRPKHPALPQDGLPADAWTGFLETRTGQVSTRDDVRPFNSDEQRRILRVGACLVCHDQHSAVMQESLTDFSSVLRRCTPRCALPQ